MSTYALTYRTAYGLHMLPVLAASMRAAWDCAFDVVEALGLPVAGFGLHRVGAAA